MTLKQILSQLEQLQLALDDYVENDDIIDSEDDLYIALGCFEEARSILHTRVQERVHVQRIQNEKKLEEELETIADRLEDEEDGREVFEDFRERAFTRGLG